EVEPGNEKVSRERTMSRAAGYADFFPAAPSVIAAKERIARERAQAEDPYSKEEPRGAPTSNDTNGANDTSTKGVNRNTSILTPNTTTSSPPAALSPHSSNRYDQPPNGSHPVEEGGNTFITPKATPPAHLESVRNLKCIYDPELLPKGAPRS